MDLDVRGRLKNFILPNSSALLPVFEAVINGVHAVRDARTYNGTVIVEIERRGQRELEGGKEPIFAFTIKDNGIGFTDENYKSFDTSDTQKKAHIGGRGVGRLTWVKAFDEVLVDSVYAASDGKLRRRSFQFSADGITALKDEAAPDGTPATGTTVRLRQMKPQYYKDLPKSGETIAERMVDHFVAALPDRREVRVVIDDDGETFDVTTQIADLLKTASKSSITLAGSEFNLTHLRVFSNDVRGHRIAYLANDRAVKYETLKDVPHLKARLVDADGRSFWWRTLVQSTALDEAGSPERGSFIFPEEPDELELFPSARAPLTMKAIHDAVVAKIQEELEPLLVPLRKRVVEEAQTYVDAEAPQYRHILKIKRGEVERLPPGLPREKLDVELRRIRFRHEEEMRERAVVLDNAQHEQPSEAAKAYAEFVSEVNASAMDDLAKYVRDRRVILNLLRRAVRSDEKGKYVLEKAIHELVLPMRVTSNDVPYEQMNLWLIDERLAFHSYLASDKTLSMVEAVDSDSAKRPDVIVFNRPLAFSESSAPFQSVVIVEFKRPMREDYDEKENPISQVYDYVRDVRGGKVRTREGRPLNVPPTVPFYCYVVCDVTPNLRKYATNADLRQSWDDQGYFGYNGALHAYVEVISFDKLIDDAEKRNRIFFEKLGLPKPT